MVSGGSNGFSIRHTNITADFVAQAHARSLSVAVWTVNNETDMTNAIMKGVDGIITDYPSLALSAITKFNNPSNDKDFFRIRVYVFWPVVAVAAALLALSIGIAIFYYRRTVYFKLNNFEW